MSLSVSTRIALIVDDHESVRQALAALLEGEFDQILEAQDGKDALEILAQEPDVGVVLLDLNMPVMGGLELLERMKARGFDVPVLVLSGDPGLDSVVEAMRRGASDFFPKPLQPEIVLRKVRAVMNDRATRRENLRLRTLLQGEMAPFSLLGNSQAMRQILPSLRKLASSPTTVLINGESGTGKEMAARALHSLGSRAAEPFGVVDCGALTPTVIESELFGHEKGSFTGAHARKTGLFLSAGKGTVFLDEIGELPLEVQAKLLRVLQERQVRPVGTSSWFPLEARVVAATNRDLEEEVRAGRFRQDLFYRLNVVRVEMPPMRRRLEDLPVLVSHFLAKHTPSDGPEMSISESELKKLLHYRWPGNVRELENAIERAIALSDSPQLCAEDILPPTWGEEPPSSMPMESAPPPGSPMGNSSPSPTTAIRLVDLERQAIGEALRRTHGSRRQAAKMLGIGEATLYRKLKDYGLREAEV
jgi:DNA-binding NtrC family response regulator